MNPYDRTEPDEVQLPARRTRPSPAESLARRTQREQQELAKKRANIATGCVRRKKSIAIFQRTYARWLANRTPDELTSILSSANPIAVRNDAKKELFLELYKEMWPNKVDALAACGTNLTWLRDQLKRDPDYAACVLEVELRRLDTLKAFSYEQSFHPQNVNERLFWLKTIGRDEFGDEPLVNITNVVSNKAEGFDRLEALLKRRAELTRQREALLAHTPSAPGPGQPEPDNGGAGEPQPRT